MRTRRILLLFFHVFLLTTIPSNICDFHNNNIDNEYQEEHHSLWSRFDNDIYRKIVKSQEEYNSSKSDVYTLLRAVIKEDLKPFLNGIIPSAIAAASHYGTKYQLIDHTLYRQKECLFPSRCEGIEHFLLKLTNLSDYEIIVNTRDNPQVPKYFNRQIPIFSFSKTDEFLDIIYPAWSFWSGGPAIKLYPTGIGRWDKLRKSLTAKAEEWTWDKKKNIAFFRGSRTSSERDEMIYLSRESPDVIDAAYTKNQAWKSKEDTLNADPAAEVSFEDHCLYKYLFNFRGVAASFRFKHLFLCKSLVFHVGNEWKEFFYPLLKPWIHYVPIESSYTREDLRNILGFFKKHDDLAKKIAENGYNIINEHLTHSKVSWYWKILLKRYIKLQTFKPTLNPTFIKVKSK